MMEKFLRTHSWLALILVAFLALGVTYSVITPIFEAGDEIWHYPYVQHLATGHSFPVQEPGVKTLWAQEGGQPPLYYALAALATFWIDTRDLPERLWLNPHAAIGIPLLYGNKNMVVHTSAENFPWHNTALAVHLIRLLSVMFSAVTVALTYFLACEIGRAPSKNSMSFRAEREIPAAETRFLVAQNAPRNDNLALAALAAAFVAFNPMFIFISASVNNDSLAAMLATLALLLLTQLVTRGTTTRRFILLGIVLGLAAITKASDLGLVVAASFVFIYLLRKERAGERASGRVFLSLSRSPLLPRMVVCAALVILISAWWYARNYFLYGDPFAFNVWVAIAGGRPSPVTLASLLGEFQGLRISFWGNFGGVNIIAPEWVYTALDALTIVAAVGLFLGLACRGLPRLIALPAFWLALIFIALVRWTMLTFASQGRLLFPAISAVAILLAYGLQQLQMTNDKLQMKLRLSSLSFVHLPFVIFLLIFSALTPFLLIAPTYALPKRLAADASVPNPIHITFDNHAELVGYELPQKAITNNELPVTLFWRALAPMDEDFSVYIHLLDTAGKIIGQWDAYPGNGLYPTRLWQTNEVIKDNYRVPVSAEAQGPSVGRVEVGLYRLETLKNLTARDPQGRVITPSIARFKIPGRAEVRVENPVSVNFGDRIALVGWGRDERVAVDQSFNVRLDWRALKAMDEDYTVFVHLVDANGKTVAQKDDQPQHGVYPTSFWDAGETVADAYAVEIPRDLAAGDYRLWVGVYRASDGSRLPVNGSDYANLGIVQIVR